MGKKKRIWAYTGFYLNYAKGSLIQPMARYMVSLTVNINPRDPKGSAVAEQMFFKQLDKYFKELLKLIQNIYNQVFMIESIIDLDLFWNVNND